MDLSDLAKRSRYIQKTAKTKLSYDEFKELRDLITQELNEFIDDEIEKD